MPCPNIDLILPDSRAGSAHGKEMPPGWSRKSSRWLLRRGACLAACQIHRAGRERTIGTNSQAPDVRFTSAGERGCCCRRIGRNESAACVVITPIAALVYDFVDDDEAFVTDCGLYWRAISRWVMPAPSERKKKTLFRGAGLAVAGPESRTLGNEKNHARRLRFLQKPTSRSSLRMVSLSTMIELVDEIRAKTIAPYSKLERAARQPPRPSPAPAR